MNLDIQIEGIETTIEYLKDEREDLNKKIAENRKNLAICRSILEELKKKKEASK